MKKIIFEDATEGLAKLLGEIITIYCDSWIYTGRLAGVNDQDVLLQQASIVYNTGSHDSKTWESKERLPGDWYIRTSKIESYGKFKEDI